MTNDQKKDIDRSESFKVRKQKLQSLQKNQYNCDMKKGVLIYLIIKGLLLTVRLYLNPL